MATVQTYPYPANSGGFIAAGDATTVHVMQDAGDAAARRERWERMRSLRKMGSTQLSMGILLAINGGLAIVYECYLANIGNAIWSGLCFFAVAGVIGAGVSASTQKGTITLYAVWSGFSTLCGGQLFGMAVYGATKELEFICQPAIDEIEICDYTIEGRIALDSCIAIVAFLGMIASAAGTVVCCYIPAPPKTRVVIQAAQVQPPMNAVPPTAFTNPSFVPSDPYTTHVDYAIGAVGAQPPPYAP